MKQFPKKDGKVIRFPTPKTEIAAPQTGETRVATPVRLGQYTHVVTWKGHSWPAHLNAAHPDQLLVDLRTFAKGSDTRMVYDDDHCARCGVPEQVRWDAHGSSPPGFAFVPRRGTDPAPSPPSR